MTAPVSWVTTSPRVAPGLLSWSAWNVLRTAVVATAPGHPQAGALAAAQVVVHVLADPSPQSVLGLAAGRPLAWLAAPDGEEWLAAALQAVGVEVVRVAGSTDLPGAHLLDAVAVMDRLRSPGGCPWDSEQTHASLAPYLLEEAYEAHEAIELDEPATLRDELGDVLLQVLFHARIASERLPAPDGFDIDAVADALTAKLVRRHPHVFADAVLANAAEVSRRWEEIKADERPGSGPFAGVAFTAPALAVAAKLYDRAAAAGLPLEQFTAPVRGGSAGSAAGTASSPGTSAGPGDPAGAAGLARADGTGGFANIGWELLGVVARARVGGVDPEAALRAAARELRDRLVGDAERAPAQPRTTGAAGVTEATGGQPGATAPAG